MQHLKKVLSFLILFSMNANAQLPEKMQKIMMKTMNAEGHLTEQMHTVFWKEIRSSASDKEVEAIKKVLNVSALFAQKYQIELWLSSKISYENKVVVKTLRLIELEQQIPVLFEETIPYAKGTDAYNNSLKLYDNQMAVSIENSKRLLQGSAQRGSFTSVQGEVVTLDLDMINLIINNLDASVLRLNRLFKEEWQ